MKKKLTLKKLIIIVFTIIFIFGYIRQIATMNRIEKEIKGKQAELEELTEKNQRLQEEVEKITLNSESYIEKLARERLGMIKPGEKVVSSGTTDEDSK